MERSKTSEAVEGRLMGGYLGLGRFEIVRYKAIVEEIFQAWISKIRISTTTAGAASRTQSDVCVCPRPGLAHRRPRAFPVRVANLIHWTAKREWFTIDRII